jgi:hypothetical protein
MAEHLSVDGSRSPSFRVFVEGIRAVASTFATKAARTE